MLGNKGLHGWMAELLRYSVHEDEKCRNEMNGCGTEYVHTLETMEENDNQLTEPI